MSKKLKLAFIVSIVLNVLLAGVILGDLPRRFDRAPRSGERMIKRDLAALPEPLRTRFREKMEQARRSGMRAKIRQERNEAIRLLAAEPFDEAAFDRQVKKIQDLRLQMTQSMADSIKDLAKDLPQEERKALAEVLKRPPPRPRR
ncbi:MAG: periplasmic heavy metal sensor [Candidatus Binatia bacterium]